MSNEKVNSLIEILKDLPLEKWNQIKNEIDITYRDVEYKKVPNSQLETLRENLIHKLELWNMYFMSIALIIDPYKSVIFDIILLYPHIWLFIINVVIIMQFYPTIKG